MRSTGKGYIGNARIIDFLSDSAEQVLKKIDRNKTVLVYCASGGRSSDCAVLMQGLGFRNIVNLEKGYDDWKKRGYPVENRK
jgi:phage shock protein E